MSVLQVTIANAAMHTMTPTGATIPGWISTSVIALGVIWSLGLGLMLLLHTCAPLLHWESYQQKARFKMIQITISALTLAAAVLPYIWMQSPTLALALTGCFIIVMGLAHYQHHEKYIAPHISE